MLEQAILRDPEAWDSWLVFADWLAEQGDVRGRLIGLEHRAASTTKIDEQARLRAEIDELLEAHQGSWAVAEVPESWGFEWRHGFIVGLALPLDDEGLEQLDRLLAQPSGRLLMNLRVQLAEDERDEDEDEDRELDHEPEPLPAARVQALLELPLQRIRSLSFPYAPLGRAGVELLAAWPGLSRLRALDLRYNELGDAGLEPLWRSRLSELDTLKLQRNRLGAASAQALASASSLERLRILDLRDNPLGRDGAAALAAAPRLRGLEALHLYRSDVELAGARALADSEHLPSHIRRYWAGQWSAANDRANGDQASD